MRQGILAIAAAGSLFAITAAGATGVGLDIGSPQSVSSPATGTSSVTLNGCSDVFTLTYLTTGSTGITSVVAVSDTHVTRDALCGTPATAALTLNAVGSTAAYTATGSTGVLTDTWTFTLDSAVATTATSLATSMTITP